MQLMDVNQPLVMSSREIAELTGKEHRNVLRDFESISEQIGQHCTRINALSYLGSSPRNISIIK